MSLREHVYAALRRDGDLLLLLNGVADAVMPTWTPDSPPYRRFLILRWGTSQRGIATANSLGLMLWAYDRDLAYDSVDAILNRSRTILDGLANTPTGAGNYLMNVGWDSGSEDLFDDVYGAVTRHHDYTLVATGVA